jgi:hypothetical protein
MPALFVWGTRSMAESVGEPSMFKACHPGASPSASYETAAEGDKSFGDNKMNSLLTIEMITLESLRVLTNSLVTAGLVNRQ